LLQTIGFADIKVQGAPYHDVPRPFRPLDRALCHLPSLASNLLVAARKPRERPSGMMAEGEFRAI
jgi:hypothetical protein